ncbi:hypothetical protein VTP01DRAFT_5920, partial [Rhizomucor pusillus]|uniref:uncharacterized protein n=1 Tax=Rhizomucor pusillus TaxID=4840 RepID=UPI0037431FF7
MQALIVITAGRTIRLLRMDSPRGYSCLKYLDKTGNSRKLAPATDINQVDHQTERYDLFQLRPFPELLRRVASSGHATYQLEHKYVICALLKNTFGNPANPRL